MASTAATRGLPMLAAYCAAKAGRDRVHPRPRRRARRDRRHRQRRRPGSTRTAILDESARLYGLESAEAFAAQQPLGRLIEPEEVAALIAWLASSRARGATGGDYPLDGGLAL